MPQLPPVNNDFGAPLPRLSVWGFCEGDYTHRAIDTQRFFWDVHIISTAQYQFRNPLQPQARPSDPLNSRELIEWPTLLDPPLPGKFDQNALLPIWSSIDGQTITWPWWYRILNVVLQPLIFQPGATAADIFAHCPEHTTELFEIELVLAWLESVNAVSKIPSRGYLVSPGFWAAFGDKLFNMEDDWVGEHVKRKNKNHQDQHWRRQDGAQHSTTRTRVIERIGDTPANREDAEIQHQPTSEINPSRQIAQYLRRRHRTKHQSLEVHRSSSVNEDENENDVLPFIPAPSEQTNAQDRPSSSGSLIQNPIAPTRNEADNRVPYSDDLDAEGEVEEIMDVS